MFFQKYIIVSTIEDKLDKICIDNVNSFRILSWLPDHGRFYDNSPCTLTVADTTVPGLCQLTEDSFTDNLSIH